MGIATEARARLSDCLLATSHRAKKLLVASALIYIILLTFGHPPIVLFPLSRFTSSLWSGTEAEFPFVPPPIPCVGAIFTTDNTFYGQLNSLQINWGWPTPFKAQICFVTKSSFYPKWSVILLGKVKVFEAVGLSKNLKGNLSKAFISSLEYFWPKI